MSFLSTLFGGGAKPSPTPGPAAPRISDASIEASDREQSARLRRRKGLDDTILTSGLGDSAPAAGTTQTTSLLGGSGTV